MMLTTGGVLADGFDEETQIGLWIVDAQEWRTISIDGTVVKRFAHLIAFALAEVLIAAAGPEVVRARRESTRHRDLDRWSREHAVRSIFLHRYGATDKERRLEARAGADGTSLKAPAGNRFEILVRGHHRHRPPAWHVDA